MGRYIGRLADGLRDMGFSHDVLIMRSNGGVAKATTVADLPIETFLSGPAAAVVAAQHIGRQAGMPVDHRTLWPTPSSCAIQHSCIGTWKTKTEKYHTTRPGPQRESR